MMWRCMVREMVINVLKENTASFFGIEDSFSALKMEAVCCSKMVVPIYQTWRRKQPKQLRIRNINTHNRQNIHLKNQNLHRA